MSRLKTIVVVLHSKWLFSIDMISLKEYYFRREHIPKTVTVSKSCSQ